MSDATLRLEANALGLGLPSESLRLEQSVPPFGAASLTIVGHQGQPLQITVEVEGVHREQGEALRATVVDLVDDLLLKLSLRCGVYIGDAKFNSDNLDRLDSQPRSAGTYLHKDDGVIEYSVGDTLPAQIGSLRDGALERVVIFGAGEESDVLGSMMQTATGSLFFRRTYRDILMQTSPMSQFVLMYMLLGAILPRRGPRESEQRAIDDWVCEAVTPPIECTPSAHHGESESPFTRIRNSLAHPRDRGMDVERLGRDVQQWLPRLKTLTLEAIARFSDGE